MAKDNIKRKYSIAEACELALFLLRTKLIDRRIRLIRFPIILRGRKYIDFGECLTTGYWCRLEALQINDNPKKRIIFGKNMQINDFVHISALERVEIGDGCLFASHIYISDSSHGDYGGGGESAPSIAPDHRPYVSFPVKIGKNVWLGEGVIVMPGVTIGDGCVIGAHSVVNKDIPAACIAVGSPARVIKKYNYDLKKWQEVDK